MPNQPFVATPEYLIKEATREFTPEEPGRPKGMWLAQLLAGLGDALVSGETGHPTSRASGAIQQLMEFRRQESKQEQMREEDLRRQRAQMLGRQAERVRGEQTEDRRMREGEMIAGQRREQNIEDQIAQEERAEARQVRAEDRQARRLAEMARTEKDPDAKMRQSEAIALRNAYILGDPASQMPSIVERLKAGQKPEDILREFKLRLDYFGVTDEEAQAALLDIQEEIDRLAPSEDASQKNQPQRSIIPKESAGRAGALLDIPLIGPALAAREAVGGVRQDLLGDIGRALGIAFGNRPGTSGRSH